MNGYRDRMTKGNENSSSEYEPEDVHRFEQPQKSVRKNENSRKYNTLKTYLRTVILVFLFIALTAGLTTMTVLFSVEKNKSKDREMLFKQQEGYVQDRIQNISQQDDNWKKEFDKLKEQQNLLNQQLIDGNLLENIDVRDRIAIELELFKRDYNFKWIGVTDILQEGVYVYESNGSRVVVDNWAYGQPGKLGRKENCIVAQKADNWKWHDIKCNYYYPYLCQKSNIRRG